MSKVEEFIQNYTRNCSNVVAYSGMIEDSELRYQEWLTPDQARRAVEIAREEVIEWLSYHLDTSKIDVDYKFEVIEELRKAMKDE